MLKLSHVDPLEYDLLFERFLDPNRSEAPDIDIDFCQDRREEVIAYVRQKYGEAERRPDRAPSARWRPGPPIKDVGRVLDVPLERVDAAHQDDPARRSDITLDDAPRAEPRPASRSTRATRRSAS